MKYLIELWAKPYHYAKFMSYSIPGECTCNWCLWMIPGTCDEDRA